MKVAFANTGDASGRDLQKHARELEKEGEFEKAVPLYKRMIKMHYRREYSYQRLMIVYRKLGEYQKELEVIEDAIREFSKFLFQSGRNHGKKIETLSRKLSISTGLAGRGGDNLHQPQPISSWQTRKKGLLKLMKKK